MENNLIVTFDTEKGELTFTMKDHNVVVQGFQTGTNNTHIKVLQPLEQAEIALKLNTNVLKSLK